MDNKSMWTYAPLVIGRKIMHWESLLKMAAVCCHLDLDIFSDAHCFDSAGYFWFSWSIRLYKTTFNMYICSRFTKQVRSGVSLRYLLWRAKGEPIKLQHQHAGYLSGQVIRTETLPSVWGWGPLNPSWILALSSCTIASSELYEQECLGFTCYKRHVAYVCDFLWNRTELCVCFFLRL